MRPVRLPTRPSKRSIRNALAFMGGATTMEAGRKRGPQQEGNTNKEVAKWASGRNTLVLGRNKRRLATPVGYHQPIMLGWLVDGSADWIGWESVVITPDMLNKRIAVFVGLEAKRKSGGVTSKQQEEFLDRLRDDGGIVGVVRCFEDCEAARTRWRER